MNGETLFGQEIVQRHVDGRTIPLTCDAGPIRDVQGRLIGGVVAWQDITDRKQAEAALRESERFLKNVFDAIQDGMSVRRRGPGNA